MSLKLKIGALTDVGLVRANNEDNLLTIPDLTVTATGCDGARVYDLGANGALMVVADGMGGMNAGEVASEIAISTIKNAFMPMNITPDVVKNRAAIEKFMNDAIVLADARIKAAANRNPESQGMGTTIVLAWILNDKLYVSWCGDSRAYVFNSAGLHQITKDHSYVQSLVDQGEITRDQAFDYPQSNVITRSLCDGMGPAEPESLFKPYPLANGDTIIICTDGVSGMLRDNELEQVIGSSPDDTDSLMANIKQAVQQAGAADNFTMCVAQIVDGALPEPDTPFFKTTEAMLDGKIPSATIPASPQKKQSSKMPWKLVGIVAIVAIICAIAAAFIFSPSGNKKDAPAPDETVVDTPAPEEQPVGTAAQPTKQTGKQPAKSSAKPSKQPEKTANEEPGVVQSITSAANDGAQTADDAESGASSKTSTASKIIGKHTGKTEQETPAVPVKTNPQSDPDKPNASDPQVTPAPAGLTVPPPPAKGEDKPAEKQPSVAKQIGN